MRNISLKVPITIGLLLVLLATLLQTGCNSSSETTSSTTGITSTTTPNSTFPSLSTTLPSFTLPPGTDLVFETIIESGNIGVPNNYKEKSAQIIVISSNQTLPAEALGWVHPEYKNRILDVDYSTNFVVMAFNGYRGGIFSDFMIQEIRQDFKTVFLVAHFNDVIPTGTSLPVFSSQYQVVKIGRSQITQTGAITFKLLDETGNERATTTIEINN